VTERLRSLSDEHLGRAIASLEVEWPPSPDLADAVMATTRTSAARVTRLPMTRPKRILLLAAATVLLLAGAAVAAKVLIDLGAVVVEVTPRPGALPSPTEIPFGREVTLQEAADLLGDDVELPRRLGPPDRMWADELLTVGGEVVRVSAAWRPEPGLPAIPGTRYGAVLMRFEGDTNQASKELYEDTGVLQFLTVGGVEYAWTTGEHLLELLTSEGVVFVPVEGNVLLWRDGPYTLRLETTLPKAEALRIAESVAGTS
jgi:hypothetical protein